MKLNIDLKDIKFERKKEFKKGSSEFNPTPYWNFILALGLVLVVLSFTYTFLIFRKTNKELSPAYNNISSEGGLPKDRINKVLLYFKEKDENSKEIINTPPPIIDPSL